jgi:hypothetical protein
MSGNAVRDRRRWGAAATPVVERSTEVPAEIVAGLARCSDRPWRKWLERERLKKGSGGKGGADYAGHGGVWSMRGKQLAAARAACKENVGADCRLERTGRGERKGAERVEEWEMGCARDAAMRI